jgi:hypothetical protein
VACGAHCTCLDEAELVQRHHRGRVVPVRRHGSRCGVARAREMDRIKSKGRVGEAREVVRNSATLVYSQSTAYCTASVQPHRLRDM